MNYLFKAYMILLIFVWKDDTWRAPNSNGVIDNLLVLQSFPKPVTLSPKNSNNSVDLLRRFVKIFWLNGHIVNYVSTTWSFSFEPPWAI